MARLAPTPSTIHKLLALSGGICSYEDCGASLVQEEVFNATLAHICAASPEGPRYDTSMTDEDRRSFENLMYMCPSHGSLVDKEKLHAKYTVEKLRQVKADHERRHSGRPYIPTDDIFDDAFQEAQIMAVQNNTINGDRNTQINTQLVVAAGEQFSESVAVLLKSVGQHVPSTKSESDTDDEEPQDPGTPSRPSGPAPSVGPNDTGRGKDGTDDDVPGLIDSIATAEELTPQWTQTISDINAEIIKVGEYTKESANILTAQNRRNANMSAKLPVFKQLAKRLSDPADKIEDLTAQFTLQLNEIDPGVRAMLELAAENAHQSEDNKTAALNLYSSIEELVISSNEGFSSLEGMLESTRPIEKMSKDLKKPLLRIRNSLELMLRGRDTIEEWLALIKNSRDIR